MRIFVGLIALLTAVAGPLPTSAGAAGAEAGGKGAVVEQAWARASIGTSRPAAAYVTVANESGDGDRRVEPRGGKG